MSGREGAPYEVVDSRERGRSGRIVLLEEDIRWPDGSTGREVAIHGPSASFVVPVFPDLTTVLVGQWRHAWGEVSWEVPAGRLDGDEDALAAARRELAEEAGLQAASWRPLGAVRGWASGSMTAHLFLARELTRVERAPEPDERDMVLRELPLADALEMALSGGMRHASSIAAVCRAARALDRG